MSDKIEDWEIPANLTAPQIDFVLFYAKEDEAKAEAFVERLEKLGYLGCLYDDKTYLEWTVNLGLNLIDELFRRTTYKIFLVSNHGDPDLDLPKADAIRTSMHSGDGSVFPVFLIPKNDIPDHGFGFGWKSFTGLHIEDNDRKFKKIFEMKDAVKSKRLREKEQEKEKTKWIEEELDRREKQRILDDVEKQEMKKQSNEQFAEKITAIPKQVKNKLAQQAQQPQSSPFVGQPTRSSTHINTELLQTLAGKLNVDSSVIQQMVDQSRIQQENVAELLKQFASVNQANLRMFEDFMGRQTGTDDKDSVRNLAGATGDRYNVHIHNPHGPVTIGPQTKTEGNDVGENLLTTDGSTSEFSDMPPTQGGGVYPRHTTPSPSEEKKESEKKRGFDFEKEFVTDPHQPDVIPKQRPPPSARGHVSSVALHPTPATSSRLDPSADGIGTNTSMSKSFMISSTGLSEEIKGPEPGSLDMLRDPALRTALENSRPTTIRDSWQYTGTDPFPRTDESGAPQEPPWAPASSTTSQRSNDTQMSCDAPDIVKPNPAVADQIMPPHLPYQSLKPGDIKLMDTSEAPVARPNPAVAVDRIMQPHLLYRTLKPDEIQFMDTSEAPDEPSAVNPLELSDSGFSDCDKTDVKALITDSTTPEVTDQTKPKILASDTEVTKTSNDQTRPKIIMPGTEMTSTIVSTNEHSVKSGAVGAQQTPVSHHTLAGTVSTGEPSVKSGAVGAQQTPVSHHILGGTVSTGEPSVKSDAVGAEQTPVSHHILGGTVSTGEPSVKSDAVGAEQTPVSHHTLAGTVSTGEPSVKSGAVGAEQTPVSHHTLAGTISNDTTHYIAVGTLNRGTTNHITDVTLCSDPHTLPLSHNTEGNIVSDSPPFGISHNTETVTATTETPNISDIKQMDTPTDGSIVPVGISLHVDDKHCAKVADKSETSGFVRVLLGASSDCSTDVPYGISDDTCKTGSDLESSDDKNIPVVVLEQEVSLNECLETNDFTVQHQSGCETSQSLDNNLRQETVNIHPTSSALAPSVGDFTTVAIGDETAIKQGYLHTDNEPDVVHESHDPDVVHESHDPVAIDTNEGLVGTEMDLQTIRQIEDDDSILCSPSDGGATGAHSCSNPAEDGTWV